MNEKKTNKAKVKWKMNFISINNQIFKGEVVAINKTTAMLITYDFINIDEIIKLQILPFYEGKSYKIQSIAKVNYWALTGKSTYEVGVIFQSMNQEGMQFIDKFFKERNT